MIHSIREFSKGSKKPNEYLFMEVTMSVVFVAIIVFSALVLLAV